MEFTGGSILEIEYKNERPSNQEIREKLKEFDLGSFYIQPTEERGVIIRMKTLDEDTHQKILEKMRQDKEIEEKRFESIGPVIGQELKEKTKIVVVLSLLAMVIYIAFAFRGVGRPIRSWQYGLVTLLILSHDVLIPLAVFSILGEYYGVQITIPVIVALLTIVGYAINNVVVVFDRIRENIIIKRGGMSFEEIVNAALNQTFTRCLNTSLTTLLVLFAIYFLGGETLKDFSLVLIIGISAGFYSALFLASPILVVWLRWKEGRRRLI